MGKNSVTVRVNKEIYCLLKQKSEETDVPISRLIARAVQEAMAK